MLNVPRKQSLEEQTATILRAEIARKTWTGCLPGERSLCEMLQVSRHTLRRALGQLREQGDIVSQQGIGNRILFRKSTARPGRLLSREVGLLIPGDLEGLLPQQVMWIDYLRGMLSERDCRLHLFYGRKFARKDPGRALRQLVTQHTHRCWILLLSSESVQQWFQASQIPCVVAGSLYGGVSLPCCDVDQHAVCRHAAGVLLGRGHRQLALLMQKTKRAGDIESEAGFVEGARRAGASVMFGYHDATPGGIATAVRRLMQCKPAPTAFMVANSVHLIGVLSCLARLGSRIPENVSIISRDGGPYCDYVMPPLTHYALSPRIFAKTLFAQVLQLLETGSVTKRVSKIMPDYRPGQSVAAL